MSNANMYNPKLPHLCFSVLETTGELVIIENGEKGYSTCSFSSSDTEYNKRTVAYNNERLGVTPIQEKAMVYGSMFGWDKPMANPDVLQEMESKRKKSLDEQLNNAMNRTGPSNRVPSYSTAKER